MLWKHPLWMQLRIHTPRSPHPIEVDINSIEIDIIQLNLAHIVMRNLIHPKY